MKKIKLWVLFSAVFIVCSAQNAHATFIWDWTFINSGVTVGSTDTVYQYGRLLNNSTDGEIIAGLEDTSGTAYVSGLTARSAWPAYDRDWPANVLDQFLGPILPGEYVDFLFITYFPNEGPVADGEYLVADQVLYLNWTGTSDSVTEGGISRDFRWTVGEVDGGSPTVPEPATMLLFGSGLVGFAFRKRKA